jgi:type IV pilus assembly protein PilB
MESEKQENEVESASNSQSLKEQADLFGFKFLEKAPKSVQGDALMMLPEESAKKYNAVIFWRDSSLIKAAILDPQNISALNVLRFIAEKERLEVEIHLTTADVMEKMMESYAGASQMVKEAVESFREDVALGKESEEKEKGYGAKSRADEILKDAPVAKLVEVIISHALDGGSSDIHIEPMEKDFRVRFRVDGVLKTGLAMPKEIGPAIVSRIKILSNLKIDERRKPQDGRFRLALRGRELDFRVSTLPVIYGEKIVLRILDKEEGLVNVESLGLLGTAVDNVMSAIAEPFGMILITGPTGSGKSTTLYALLKILNKEERNIITLEDPIEYNLEGLNQSQINPEIGYSFASGLRTILRQDPNVIMLGEVRDSETAELSVHAALTGHLMLSTLHTNTAIGAITRLMDMGIEPFLLSSSLRLVMAQRLVRRICDNCKEEKETPETFKNKILDEIKSVSKEELQKYGLDLSQGVKLFHGKGCEACGGTGLKGRVAIYEVVPISEKIQNIIIEHAGQENLVREERDRNAILSIKQDGIIKVLKGLTTMEEVERVTDIDSVALKEDEEEKSKE